MSLSRVSRWMCLNTNLEKKKERSWNIQKYAFTPNKMFKSTQFNLHGWWEKQFKKKKKKSVQNKQREGTKLVEIK